MSLVNKALLDGNIVAEPEVRYTGAGAAVTSFRLATHERYKNRETGAIETVAEFHRVVFFDKQAETLREHAKKGMSIKVEGRLRTRKWTRGDQDHYTTEILGDDFRFGPKRQEKDTDGESSDAGAEGGSPSGNHDDAPPPVDAAPQGVREPETQL